VVFPVLLFYTNSYSASPSLLQGLDSMQLESLIDSPGDTSHYLILANGMPPDETPEPTPSKDRSPKYKYERKKVRKEVIKPAKDNYEREKAHKELTERPKDKIETVEDSEEFIEETGTINDPWEPFNRAMFKFNDKFYFWVLKPTARGYRAVLPQKVRTHIRKFYSNASTPMRLINCVLQGKMKGMSIESTRFTINSTLGVGGLFDPALLLCHLEEQEVDFDQTLGLYGMKPIMYINWPFLGPSSLRGTLGLIGDNGFDPVTYLVSPPIKIGILSYEEVNETSLTIGDYESLRESALDPYIAIRNAYFQNRRSKIPSK